MYGTLSVKLYCLSSMLSIDVTSLFSAMSPLKCGCRDNTTAPAVKNQKRLYSGLDG